MPDFNKGDFTQQGVNGHVNANVRLNEKRMVNIDMTSNEAAEGCTITGTVTDLLNDKVYNIGSGGGGELSLKHLTFNIVNNLDEPVGLRKGDFVIYGCVIIRDDLLNSTFSIDAELYQFDLDDYVNTVPSGTTTSIVLPYITYDNSKIVAVAFGANDTIDKVTYNNMTYDSVNNGLAVTDVTENSVITYTPTK